jgi:hypothetical protein
VQLTAKMRQNIMLGAKAVKYPVKCDQNIGETEKHLLHHLLNAGAVPNCKIRLLKSPQYAVRKKFK